VSGQKLCYLKSDFENISQIWSPYWDDVSRATFGSLPWRSMSQHDLAAKSCPAYNFVIWSRILQLFHRNDHHNETTCHAQHLGHYLEGQGHSMTLQQNRVRPINLLLKVRFWKYFKEMITILRCHVALNIVSGQKLCDLKSNFTSIPQERSPYWDDVSRATFGSLTWRSRSQHDYAAKSCPAYYFVIGSRISKLFHRNDHHIETICRTKHLGRFLKGQGHSMTF